MQNHYQIIYTHFQDLLNKVIVPDNFLPQFREAYFKDVMMGIILTVEDLYPDVLDAHYDEIMSSDITDLDASEKGFKILAAYISDFNEIIIESCEVQSIRFIQLARNG